MNAKQDISQATAALDHSYAMLNKSHYLQSAEQSARIACGKANFSSGGSLQVLAETYASRCNYDRAEYYQKLAVIFATEDERPQLLQTFRDYTKMDDLLTEKAKAKTLLGAAGQGKRRQARRWRFGRRRFGGVRRRGVVGWDQIRGTCTRVGERRPTDLCFPSDVGGLALADPQAGAPSLVPPYGTDPKLGSVFWYMSSCSRLGPVGNCERGVYCSRRPLLRSCSCRKSSLSCSIWSSSSRAFRSFASVAVASRSLTCLCR